MSMLTGSLAVVTGGARGIGFAISKVFAREGAKVVVADLDEGACKSAISVNSWLFIKVALTPFQFKGTTWKRSLRDCHGRYKPSLCSSCL
jgi:hypothetical protein